MEEGEENVASMNRGIRKIEREIYKRNENFTKISKTKEKLDKWIVDVLNQTRKSVRDREEEEAAAGGGGENLNAINKRINKIERESDGRNEYFGKKLKRKKKWVVDPQSSNLDGISTRIMKIERKNDGRNEDFRKELKKTRQRGINDNKGAEEENLNSIKRRIRKIERENNRRNEYFTRRTKEMENLKKWALNP